MSNLFRRVATIAADAMGTPLAFLLSVCFTLSWLASGPLFHFSDTWQLVANTFTTLVTFHSGFLILYVSNRDAKAIHLKLDELIRALDAARNEFIDIEEEEDTVLDELETEMQHLHEDVSHVH